MAKNINNILEFISSWGDSEFSEILQENEAYDKLTPSEKRQFHKDYKNAQSSESSPTTKKPTTKKPITKKPYRNVVSIPNPIRGVSAALHTADALGSLVAGTGSYASGFDRLASTGNQRARNLYGPIRRQQDRPYLNK